MNPKQRTNNVPKPLVVTKMQSKCHFHIKDNAATSSDSTGKGSTRVVNDRGNQFQRRLLVGSLVKYPSKSKGKKNEPNNGDSGDGKECHITRKPLSRRELLGNNLVCGDQEPVAATLSQLVTHEEAFEPEGVACEGGKSKKIKKDKKGVRMKHPLLSFLDEKKRGWNSFIKAKARKNSRFSCDQVNGDGVVTRFGQVRRRRRNAGLWRLVRIPSRILVVRLKLKTIKSMVKKKKKGTKQWEHEDKGVTELCKRRILMGARCKPLSSSGMLRYDNDGIHLPDIVP